MKKMKLKVKKRKKKNLKRKMNLKNEMIYLGDKSKKQIFFIIQFTILKKRYLYTS